VRPAGIATGLLAGVVLAYACSVSYPRRLWSKLPGSKKVVIPPTIDAQIEKVGDFSGPRASPESVASKIETSSTVISPAAKAS
jgi:hypothetical protein